MYVAESNVRDKDTIDEDSTATDSDDSSMLQRAMSGIKIPSMKIPQPLIVMIAVCCRERCKTYIFVSSTFPQML